MEDIKNTDDIAFLMQKFYSQLLADDKIGYIFTDVVQLELEAHLPILTKFWNNTLFHTGGYKGNVVQIHKNINTLETLTPSHFKHWVSILEKTIDEHFCGKIAEKMKEKAKQVGMTIQAKLGHYE